MFGMQILDIALGLIFIYLMLSLVCTAANELIASGLRLRANNLREAIGALLNDPQLEQAFYEHPMIKSLHKKGSLPSYIPSKKFATVLLSITSEDKVSKDIKEMRTKIGSMNDSDLKQTLMTLVDNAGENIENFQEGLETWFNDTMDRAAGWYKRKIQVVTVILALLTTFLANADTIQFTRSLSSDPALRQALVEAAAAAAAKESLSGEESSALQQINDRISDVSQVGIQLGWQYFPKDARGWLSKIFGLILTTLAVSLGSPFWFDMLNKIIKIRGAGVQLSSASSKSETPAAASGEKAP